MYLSDKPIELIGQDKLDRHNFAISLAKALCSLKESDTFTVGLMGEWGVGKTSLINMVEAEYKERDSEPKSIIVRFEPWHFSDTTQLVSQFLIHLANQFTIGNITNYKKISNALLNYSSAFELASLLPIPYIGVIANFGKFLFNALGKIMQRKAIEQEDILNQKQRVIKLLKKLKKRVLVIIDDIDRLSNDQIRQVFQLISAIAKFPNITYLIAFDKNVVIKALEKVQEGNGNDYLEKIIQMPIEVPKIKANKLEKILLQEFNNLRIEFPNVTFDEGHWRIVYERCLMHYVTSIRDINRLTNLIRFKLNSLSSDVNFADIIAISAIEIFQPSIYSWIKINKDILVNISAWPKEGDPSLEEKKKSCINQLSQLNGDGNGIRNNHINSTLRSIATLFPVFGHKLLNWGIAADYGSKSIKNNYICDKNKFDRYFELDINDIGIKGADIDNALNSYSIEQLIEMIQSANEKAHISDFLTETRARIYDLSSERAEIVTGALLRCISNINSSDTNSTSLDNLRKRALRLTYDLFDMINNDRRVNLINNSIDNMTINGIGGIAQLIDVIESTHGKAPYREMYINKIITIEELSNIEKRFKEKVSTILSKQSLFSTNDWYVVYKLLKLIDSKFATKILSKEFKCDLNIVKFISLNVIECYSNNLSYKINPIDIGGLSPEIVLKAIINSKEDKSFFTLSVDMQEKAVAAYIALSDEKKSEDSVSQKEVGMVISEWKMCDC